MGGLEGFCADPCDDNNHKNYGYGMGRGGWLIGLAVLFLIIAIIWLLVDIFNCNHDDNHDYEGDRFRIGSGPATFFFLAVVFVLFAIYYKLK